MAISWKIGVNGDWNDNTKWSTNAVPGSGDDVTIAVAGAYTVTIDSADVANSLTFNASGARLEESAGSLTMAGALTVDTGFVSLKSANTIGSVTLAGGVLAFGNGSALGTGTVTMSGGELRAFANETLTNNLQISGNVTISAAHGTTLDENATNWSVAANTTLNFGSPGEDGTILWRSASNLITVGASSSVHVKAGTLKAAAPPSIPFVGLNFLVRNTTTTVDAGAAIDVAGFDTEFQDLLGGGAIIDSGGSAIVTLDSANFSGTISGDLSVDFTGNASLSGLEDWNNFTSLTGAITVTNSGTFDLTGDRDIGGDAGSSFINNGLFVKTGTGGSNVTSNFVNNGTLNVLSGRVSFGDGFTNNGVIHGIVSQTGGVTTIKAMAPGDLNGDQKADVVWRGSNGALIDWGMNGGVIASSGFATSNGTVIAPDPTFSVAGLSDFSGDGNADVLWRSTSGVLAMWIMNGSTIVGSANVTVNGALVQPDASFSVAGVGDFNGDNKSDILWRSTSGALIDWSMNGSTIIGSANITVNGTLVQPDASFNIAGIGDFNADGARDILWRSTSGQLIDWTMNGSVISDSANITLNGNLVQPDPSFSVAGIGDFNADGKADILWRSTNGTLAIWLMNGSTISASNFVTLNGVPVTPDATWRIVEVADFNGDGNSDILWRSDSGALAEWQMNGTTISQSLTPAFNGVAISPDGSFTTQTRPTNFA